MALDKATFLKPRPRQIVLIDCGLEQPARLRALLESERIEFDVWIKNSKGEISDAKMKKSRLKLIAMCMVGDDGELILDEADFVELMDLPASVTAKLAKACMTLCGLNDDDLDEAVKN